MVTPLEPATSTATASAPDQTQESMILANAAPSPSTKQRYELEGAGNERFTEEVPLARDFKVEGAGEC